MTHVPSVQYMSRYSPKIMQSNDALWWPTLSNSKEQNGIDLHSLSQPYRNWMGFPSPDASDLHVTWMEVLTDSDVWETAEFWMHTQGDREREKEVIICSIWGFIALLLTFSSVLHMDYIECVLCSECSQTTQYCAWKHPVKAQEH